MAQVKVSREKEWANRRFTYKIVVDGREELEIADGQEKMLTIDSRATVQAKLLWCGSPVVHIGIGNDEGKEIRIRANKGISVGLPLLAMILLAINLIVNNISNDQGLKDFVTSLLMGVMAVAIGVLTVGRNRFLDIEVVEKEIQYGSL